MEDANLGKAYKAWMAYNHKQKDNRIENFKPKRWLMVVNAIEGKVEFRNNRVKGFRKTWSAATRKKFKATIAARSNGHG